MKLSALSTRAADNDGVPFSPVDPRTGDEIADIRFTLISKNSDVIRKCMRDYQNRMQRDPKFRQGKLIDMDEVEAESTEAIALTIRGWTGIEDDDGTPIAYSHDEAVRLMANTGYAWLRGQIDKFTGTVANFFTQSESVSTTGLVKSSVEPLPLTPKSPAAPE